MTLVERYHALAAQGVIETDPAQAAIVTRLDALARALRHWRRRRNGFAILLSRSEPAPRGVYIFGSVGRGKTMLMDLFFETVTYRYKRRAHFHEFMAEMHDRIAAARKSTPGDPIPQVAEAIADKTALLCFDEMHITDIADAMIVGRLFRALFENQVVVVTTSNVPPRDLYRNGLNRALFLPFIDLIERNMDIRELPAAKDYRLEKLAGRLLYFTPADARASADMNRIWAELTGGQPGAPLILEVKGRKLKVPRAAMGVARFSFSELCEQPLGTVDYLALAHKFHTIMIDGIPVLAPAQRDVARRFVNLIDTLYDGRVGLIVSAAAEPGGLYPEGDVHFLFERTVSRLIEMRSAAYLAARSERLCTGEPAGRGVPSPHTSSAWGEG
jgi:cell division protein ZapE